MIDHASVVCRGDKAFLVGDSRETYMPDGIFVVPFGDCVNGKVVGDSKPTI